MSSVPSFQPLTTLSSLNSPLTSVLNTTNPTQANLTCAYVAKEALKALAAALIGYTITICLTSLASGTAALIIGGIGLTCALVALGMFERIEKSEIKRQKIQQFSNLLLDRTRACIIHDIQYKNKPEILTLIEDVRTNAHYNQTGNNGLRLKFLGAQSAIQHVLACSQALNEIKDLVGIIHRPHPVQALLTPINRDFAKHLLDPSIANNLDKLLEVKPYEEVIREYLEKGGKLYVAYPKGGLEKLTHAEQTTYKNELHKYPGKLIDTALNCEEFSSEMIGATYLFKDREENLYSFSIKAAPENESQQPAQWGIWLGTITNSVVKARVNAVLDYIKKNNTPNSISKELPPLC